VPSYDAIIIGTGQAGPSLAKRLTSAGMRIAIIERDKFGGTCVNTGCIPTKTMVASAYAAHMAKRAGEFGVMIDSPVRVDMKKVKARKDEVSRKSSRGIETWLKQMGGCTVYGGHAQFESAHEVSVNGIKLAAERIFINAGGRAAIPEIPGRETVEYLTNSSMMAIDFLPEHLLILGGGYIGLEFGQMFRRFGSRVTIAARGPRLLAQEDPDIAQTILDILRGEEIDIRLGSQCTKLQKDGDGVVATLESGGEKSELRASHVLFAMGRRPNTDDLGIEKAGIAVDAHGYIVTDDQLRTNVPGVWALGDCNGKGAFTHTSYNDYEIVAANLLDNDPRRVSDRIPAHCVYIDPPLGRAGMTEAEVRHSGRKALIAKRPMTRVSRAVEKGESLGFMKLLVDAESRQFLGASLLGVGCDEVVHSILDMMYAKQPYTVVQRAMHIHPTVSELIPTMLGELQPLGG
jgi:pyruvate/2-oxoglutarate dehydrogenase complex dihydrolipoamide dehydrogenase (E3) component